MPSSMSFACKKKADCLRSSTPVFNYAYKHNWPNKKLMKVLGKSSIYIKRCGQQQLLLMMLLVMLLPGCGCASDFPALLRSKDHTRNHRRIVAQLSKSGGALRHAIQLSSSLCLVSALSSAASLHRSKECYETKERDGRFQRAR